MLKDKLAFIIICIYLVTLKPFSVASFEEKYVYGEPKYKCPKRAAVIFPCNCVNGSDVGLHVKCENVNLATLSVAIQNLAALNVPIEHLSIFKGHFVRLFGPIFSKLNARLMTIEDSPIEIIEDYTFHGINKTLEKLFIYNSNLTQLSPLSFGNLGKLVELHINGHSLPKLEKNLFTNQEISNVLETLAIVNGTLSDIPIETFQPLRKLKKLDLHANQLEALKNSQFKNLRSVEVLDISFNKIKKLEAQHIADMTKLGWLNVSSNALTEISRGAFARNSVLKVLNMAYNQITRLDVNSFRGMRFLRRLYLSDNNISDVARGTFAAVAKIGTIDLARNALKKIQYQMFSQLNYVEILDMSENSITIVEKNSFKDIYQASINISHNMLEKIEPKSFENCVNITVLDLSHNRLQNFSKNSFDENTYATVFQLSHNLLTNLAQVPIQNMSGLKVLNVSYNHIQEIPKNCFPKLYEFHTIDASHNNISLIANGVFQTLFSLRFIDLSYNSLQEIKSSVFGTLPTLLEMNLSYNNLTAIVRGALAKLTSMRSLNLNNNRLEKLFQIPISLNELHMSHNRITAIPSGTWPVMNSLIYLDLSHNEIGDSLMSDSFTGLLVVQRLFLQKNGITLPPLESVQGMTTLQYLYLQDNNITTLDKSAFGKLPVLFELNLHGNKINDISKRAFEGLLQLLTLNLSSNALNSIPNDAFIGLPSLRRLDLAVNNLTKLDNKTHGVLDDLLSLEYLNLSYNKISFVTKKTFPEYQYIPYNLRYLDLSHNQMPILTYDITFGTKKLVHLNISNNNIKEIRRGVLSNFTALQYLDLSFNELTDLSSEEHGFDLPQNLTEIYLQNNQIYSIPFEKFRKVPAMITINLKNNHLLEFPHSLVNNIKNGSDVLFAGNPLHCNCAARPLKHFIMERASPTEDFQEIVCATPEHVRNIDLVEVLDENLLCNTNEDRDVHKGSDYDELTDILFRDIKFNFKTKNASLQWFVASKTKDIAGFTIYVRDKDNNILYQSEYSYNERKAEVSLASLPAQGTALYNSELCIISKNSNEITGRWFVMQCKPLSNISTNRKKFFESISSKAEKLNLPYYLFIALYLCIL